MDKKKRWSAYLSPEFTKELQALRAEFEMTEGQLMLMFVKLGYQAFMRSYKPQDTLTPEAWKKIMEVSPNEGKNT